MEYEHLSEVQTFETCCQRIQELCAGGWFLCEVEHLPRSLKRASSDEEVAENIKNQPIRIVFYRPVKHPDRMTVIVQ